MSKGAVYRIEQKRRQLQELKASEEMARALLDATDSSALLLDAEGTVLAVNRMAAARLGIDRRKLLGTCIYDIFAAPLAHSRRDMTQKVIETGEPSYFEDSREGHDFLTSIYPVMGGDGSVSRVAVFATDVTEYNYVSEALQESRERYRVLAEAAQDVIFIIDSDDRVEYLNSFAANLFGARQRELIGQKRSRLFPTEIAERQEANIREVLDSGMPVTSESQIVIGGRAIWQNTILAPIRDRRGNPAVLGISRDISDHKRAEDELRISQERLKAQFMALPLPTYTWRRDGDDFTLIDFNQAAVAITRGGVEQTMGKPARHELRNNPDLLDCLEECYRTGETIKRVQEVSFSSMGTKLVLSTYVFVPPDMVSVHTEDLTEKRQAQDALARAQERYRSIFENARDGIFHAGIKSGIQTANESFARILGYESGAQLMEEVANFSDLCATRKSYTELVRMIRGEENVSGYELQLRRRDGSLIWVALNVHGLRGHNDRMTGFEGIIMDINGRKHRDELGDALNRVTDAMSSTLDLGHIMNIAVTEAAKALGCQSATVTMRENEQWVLRYLYKLPKKMIGERFFDEEIPHVALAALTRKPVTVSDVTGVARTESFDYKSYLVVPLVLRDDVLGVISFNYHSTAVPFSEARIDFAGRLAASVTQAVENARLYEHEQEGRARIQSYAKQLAVLHEISLSLNRQTDLRRLIDIILTGAAELTLAGSGIVILDSGSPEEIISWHSAPWQESGFRLSADPETLRKRIAHLAQRRVNVARFDEWGLLAAVIRDSSGRARGMLVLANKAGSDCFTEEDEEIITLLANQSSVALVSAEKFEREHRVAEVLQAAMLPATPSGEELDLGLVYRSAGPYKVGGDFYDFVHLADDRMAVVLGDVCGKGLDAATYTAMIKYMLRAYLTEGRLPGDCLTRLNHAVYKEISEDKFVTVGLALLDLRRNVINYASAGHPRPVIFSGKRPDFLEVTNSVPLGVVEDHKYSSLETRIKGPCTLLMYTDGLIEARHGDGSPFGEARLLEAFSLCGSLPPQRIVDQLLLHAMDHSGGKLRDDIALMALRPF